MWFRKVKACILPLVAAAIISAAGFVSAADIEYVFPALVSTIQEMTELQQRETIDKLKGKSIEGEGELRDVGECSKYSSTKKWRKQGCYEITVESNAPRAGWSYADDIVMYMSKSEKNKLLSLDKGSQIRFKSCTILSVEKRGSFDKWWRIECDAPILIH